MPMMPPARTAPKRCRVIVSQSFIMFSPYVGQTHFWQCNFFSLPAFARVSGIDPDSVMAIEKNPLVRFSKREIVDRVRHCGLRSATVKRVASTLHAAGADGATSRRALIGGGVNRGCPVDLCQDRLGDKRACLPDPPVIVDIQQIRSQRVTSSSKRSSSRPLKSPRDTIPTTLPPTTTGRCR